MEKEPRHVSVLWGLCAWFPTNPESLSLVSILRLSCRRLYDWKPFKSHPSCYNTSLRSLLCSLNFKPTKKPSSFNTLCTCQSLSLHIKICSSVSVSSTHPPPDCGLLKDRDPSWSSLSIQYLSTVPFFACIKLLIIIS